MDLEEKLRWAFDPLKPGRLTIQTVEPGGTTGTPAVSMRHMEVTVVSEQFDDMTEAKRQSTVWEILLKLLTKQELRRVEFVFTYTPGEAIAQFISTPEGKGKLSRSLVAGINKRRMPGPLFLGEKE